MIFYHQYLEQIHSIVMLDVWVLFLQCGGVGRICQHAYRRFPVCARTFFDKIQWNIVQQETFADKRTYLCKGRKCHLKTRGPYSAQTGVSASRNTARFSVYAERRITQKNVKTIARISPLYIDGFCPPKRSQEVITIQHRLTTLLFKNSQMWFICMQIRAFFCSEAKRLPAPVKEPIEMNTAWNMTKHQSFNNLPKSFFCYSTTRRNTFSSSNKIRCESWPFSWILAFLFANRRMLYDLLTKLRVKFVQPPSDCAHFFMWWLISPRLLDTPATTKSSWFLGSINT